MDALVSIIVPVYNAELYLDRCICSLVNQTYEQLEIILVDDGSTDSSPKICDKWSEKDRRIKAIHKRNAGAGLARNTGLDYATGRYLFFVDSDDYMDHTAVEKCVSLAGESGVDIVMFGRNNVSVDGRIEVVRLAGETCFCRDPSSIQDLLSGFFTYERGLGISVWGKMFNLELLQARGTRFFSEREILSEDACFIMEVFSYVSSVAILPQNLYYYYRNENSFSRSYQKEQQSLNDAFLKKSTDLCNKLGYPEKVLRYVTARYHTYALVGMKHIVGAQLSFGEKRAALKAVCDNKTLHDSLKKETLALAIRPSKIFWQFFKKKCYFICFLLLWYKAHR